MKTMDIKAILMGLAFVLAWSSAFTSARIIVMSAPPLGASALRFLLAGIIGVIAARALGQTWTLTRRQWRVVLIFGLCQNALYLGLYFIAMQTVEASLASVMASSMPLVVAALSIVFLRQKVPSRALLGLMIGFAGVALIMGTRISGGSDLFGIMLCVIGVVALAVATLTVGSAGVGGNMLMVVALQMFVGAVVLGVISAVFETHTVVPSVRLAVAFAYTVVVPGLFATWIWFALVQRIGTVKASSFHFLNPFFGVAIAAVILGERIGVMDVVGVFVIMGGILLVQSARQPT